MAVQDDDKFIVNRGGTDYKVSASDLDDKLQDDDQVLINRGGTDYKVSGADLRQYLGIAEDAVGILHLIVDDPAVFNDGAGDFSIIDHETIFNLATQAEVSSIDAPGEYIITGKSVSFNGCIGNWEFGPFTDTSRMVEMDFMFLRCKTFNADISNWDVSNVENMESIFSGCRSFNQDLSEWCVTKIPSRPTGFSNMPPEKEPKWGTCPRGEDQP